MNRKELSSFTSAIVNPTPARGRGVRFSAVLAAVLMFGVLPTASARAGDVNWNVVDGAFDTPGSWDPSGPPGPGDTALFALSGSHTVTFDISPTNLQAIVSDGAYDFNLSGETYTLTAVDNSVVVGDTVGFAPSLTLLGGTLAGRDGYVATASGSSGTVTVDGAGSTWTNSGNLRVGWYGTGTLNVLNGGVVSNTGGHIGYQSGSVGTATVDGSTWTNSGDLHVGVLGTGELSVLNGGVVSNTDGYIATYSGAGGTATVDGDGSTWTNSNSLYIGGLSTLAGGTGELTVSNGGTVNVTDTLKLWSGGTLNVSGGNISAAAMVNDGGTVNFTSGWLGLAGDFSVVPGGLLGPNVTLGSEMTLSVGGTLTVDGASELTVNAGGVVSADMMELVSGATFSQAAGGVLRLNSLSGYGDNPSFDGSLHLGHSAGGSVTHTVSGAQSLTVAEGLAVAYDATGTLNVQAGGVVSSTSGFLGYSSGSTGTVTVDGAGATWTNSGSLYVGGSDTEGGGTGQLTVQNQGVVQVGSLLKVWGSGTVNVTTGKVVAGGSVIGEPYDGNLLVGSDATGAMSIVDGGSVSNTNCQIGYDSGSDGTVTVNGNGSSWTNSGWLIVGRNGAGELNVFEGGVVSNISGDIGGEGPGGTATVHGTGSTWTNSYDLNVGTVGSGALNIGSGGLVEVGATTYVARYTGSSGMIYFDNGTLTTGGFAGAAADLSGVGVINTNGLVSDVDLLFDAGHGLAQTLTLNGPGQDITVNLDADGSAPMGAGWRGSGSMLISDGLDLQSYKGYLGRHSGSSGVATVDGVGSTWTISRDLDVGGQGTGTLNVLNGGVVSTDGCYITGVDSDSGGTVTVDGAGSTLMNSFELYFSGYGRATCTLNVQNGGVVSNSYDGYIGASSGTSGTATVDGAGSTWTNSENLRVGWYGTGTLYVQNGGEVSNIVGYIGDQTGSVGTATVDGSGSTWTNSIYLHVGWYGTGTLYVLNGGEVSNTAGHIGYHSNSVGTATVDGSGSTWTNSGNLHVGVLGTGELNVLNGGVVSNTDGHIGYYSGAGGTATVDGTGSTWTNSNSLYIGGSPTLAGGTGELTVSNGGTVIAGDTLKLWSGGRLNVSGGNISAAAMVNDGGTVNFTSGSLHCTGDFSVAPGEFLGSSVTLGSGMTLSVGGTLGLSSGSTLNISGGTVSAAAMVNNGGALDFTSGRLGFTGNFSVGPGEFLGSSVTLGSGMTLSVGDTLAVDGASELTVNAGGVVSSDVLEVVSGATFAQAAGSIVRVNTLSGFGDTPSFVGSLHLGHPGGITGSGAHTVSGVQSLTVGEEFVVGYDASGTLNVTGDGDVSNTTGGLGYASGGSGTVTVDGTGSTWTNSENLHVGWYGTGTLNVQNGGVVSNIDGYIGDQTGSVGTATVDGAGATWTNSGNLHVGRYGTGTLNVQNGGVVSNTDGCIATYSGAGGTATVDGAGSAWTNSNSLYIGGSSTLAGGTGELTVSNGGTVNVTDTLKLWSGGTLNVSGGTISAAAMVNDGGTLNFTSGSLHFTGDFSVAPGEFLGSNVTLGSGRTLSVGDMLTIDGGSELTLNGGRLCATNLDLGDTLDFRWGILELTGGGLVMSHTLVIPGNGTLRASGTVHPVIAGLGGSSIEATGDLLLGDATRYDGFTHAGSLSAGSHTVTLKTKGFAGLGIVTELDGGTLVAANGVIVGMGDNLVGAGVVDGKVAAGFGSIIEAGGDLALGDSSNVAGFVSDGELYTGDHTVTLFDANQAVLGSLTQLGDGADEGTLVAGNGLVVEFGKNIVGRGTVDTPNDELLPLTNNGAIIGDSPGDAIELIGYVKGAGTLENVTVSGTLSPGFSPVRLHATNLEVGSSGTLVMELGGLSGGSEYDQLDVAGDLHLGGTLQVSLIGGFAPELGDTFDILDWDTLGGAEFNAVVLPDLAGRKVWDTSRLYDTGEISVAGMLDGDTDTDWDVDRDDLANLVAVFGSEGDKYTDFNEDGRVDLADFALMRGNFGVDLGSGAPGDATATTPEPATLFVLLAGGLPMLLRRRRPFDKLRASRRS